MSEMYLYAFGSVIIVSLVSLVGLFALSFQEAVLRKYIFLLVSLAIGALLGDAFIHLIPESFEEIDALLAGILVIVGILFFFVLEKGFHWHHHHGGEGEEHAEDIPGAGMRIHPLGYMILTSDGLHNFLDGAIITASYLVSIEVGIATTIAVVLHEIPQEIGDFGVLLHAGFTKIQALFVNFLSALLAILGVIAVLVLKDQIEDLVLWLIPFAAGGFIYIASSDLIPELHKTKELKNSLLQLFAILAGVIAMISLIWFEDDEHAHEVEHEVASIKI